MTSIPDKTPRQTPSGRPPYLALAFAALILISGVLAGVLTDNRSAQADTPVAVPPPGPAASAPLPQLVGFTINMYHPYDVQPALDAVDQLHKLGFNALQLTVPVFQTHGSDTAPRRPLKPGGSPSDEQILAVLSRAKSHGMHTNLIWQINFTNPRGNEWRGKIRPPDWDAWWAAYLELLRQHAAVAARANADLFTIGCELLSTHQPEFRGRWRQAIAEARRHFPGRLVYSSTWDSFEKYPAWDGLDTVGVSGWWDLTRTAQNPDQPRDQELVTRWRQIQKGLAGFAERQRKPLLITEVGYPTIPWALRDPWNYVPRSDTKPDANAQARGYASFLAAWADVIAPPGKPTRSEKFLGVYFYEWAPFQTSGGPQDFGYSPRNKPAMPLIADWLKRDR